MRRLTTSAAVLAAAAGFAVLGSTASQADDAGKAALVNTNPISINFTGDTAGAKANGFSSVASGQVTFFDTDAANLQVGDLGNQTHGKGLFINASFSGIRMNLAAPTVGISLAFGNDDPNVSQVGDVARLTAFRNGGQVAVVEVVVNRNDVMDQRIAFDQGKIFDSVVFQYFRSDGSESNLAPVIDDIEVQPLCSVIGTDGANVLNGTGSDDVLCGGGGDDTIRGNGGNDVVFAGGGNDLVEGGPGGDKVTAGAGRDLVKGGDGGDILRGGKGNDNLQGGNGFDRCDGGPNSDTASSCEVRISIP